MWIFFSLCALIHGASTYEGGRFMRYMLYKITKASVAVSQGDQFVLKQGHEGPLASVICRTAEKFPNMSELFRMQVGERIAARMYRCSYVTVLFCFCLG